MSYKKRVIIFLSAMAVVFIILASLFFIMTRDNLNNLNEAEFIPSESRESIRSNFNSLFEYGE